MKPYQRAFVELALSRNALRFGRFTLKSGRESPYFFNAGLFDDGASLASLGRCYAAALADSGVACDMLFGPAYRASRWSRPRSRRSPSITSATCPGRSTARKPRTTARADTSSGARCPAAS